MNQGRGNKIRAAALFVLSLCFVHLADAQAQPVRDRVLSGVQVAEDRSCAVVKVNLNFPVRYLSHFPLNAGRELRIKLRSIEISPSDREGLLGRESVRPPASDLADIRKIEYEGDNPAGPVLTFSFRDEANYKVGQGTDFRSLIVAISGPEPSDTCLPIFTQKSSGGVEPPQAEAPAGPALPPTPKFDARQPVDQAASRNPFADLSRPFIINLKSSVTPAAVPQLPDVPALKGLIVYNTRFEKDGKVWHRVRAGFFATRDEAKKLLPLLAAEFPGAWIDKVPRSERQSALAQAGAMPAKAEPIPSPMLPVPPTAPPITAAEGPTALPQDKVAADEGTLATLLSEARTAMTAGDLQQSIRLLTKILQTPESKVRADAQELLGVARERNNQLAHAKAEYEEYLRRYPEGEGADRVRQRLAGLVTARKDAPQKLRKAQRPDAETGLIWSLFGSFSQFYNRDESSTEFEADGQTPIEENFVNRDELVSDLDFTATAGNDRHEAAFRFSGSYAQDFTDDGPGNETSLSALYLDLSDSEWDLTARLGRQSRSTGGVLGRFDGGLVSYQILPTVKVNAVAGYPVDSTRDSLINNARHFYGLSVDLGTFDSAWDANLFIVEQKADSIIDRRSVGGEVRYFHQDRNAFSLVDYDFYYNELNTALFIGNWIFPDQTTANLSLDYRKSPILTTTNALQGQGVESIAELLTLFSQDEINQLARDRTATSKSMTAGLSRPINEMFQFNLDATVSNLSSTTASGGVEASPATGNEFFYSAQLIGSSVVKEGDIAIVGLRYSDTSASDRYILDLNTRYPVNRSFRVSPRLRVAYRANKGSDQTQISYRPSMRLNYYVTRTFQLELEGGGEWTDDQLAGGANETTFGYFVNLGYRVDF